MKHVTILFLSLALLVLAVGLTHAAPEMLTGVQQPVARNGAAGWLVPGRTPMPTTTPTRTFTPTPIRTATPTPTFTAAPTDSPTATPTSTPWNDCYFADVQPDAIHGNPNACDDDVDVADVMRVAQCWHELVDAVCPSGIDFNQTGTIDIYDVIVVADQWGWPHH